MLALAVACSAQMQKIAWSEVAWRGAVGVGCDGVTNELIQGLSFVFALRDVCVYRCDSLSLHVEVSKI